MTAPTGCLVLGRGRIGQLLTARFRGAGVAVSNGDIDEWEQLADGHAGLVVLSLHRGSDSLPIAIRLAKRRAPVVVVDLTTQDLASVDATSATFASGGIPYFAGGLTGGAAGVAANKAMFLLGPSDIPHEIAEIFDRLGTIVRFPTARAGVVGKLLHNYVLLASSVAYAMAIAVGDEFGCLDESIEAIATGPAGRPTMAHSVVRDALSRGVTSYTARLVLKDLEQLRASLPMLAEADPSTFECARTAMQGAGGDTPFTHALVDWSRAMERVPDVAP